MAFRCRQRGIFGALRSVTMAGLGLLSWCSYLSSLYAEPTRAHEYAVKAAYTYNFLKLTNFEQAGAPMSVVRVCLYASEEQASFFQSIDGRELEYGVIKIERLRDEELPPQCNALFVARQYGVVLETLLSRAKGRGVLTFGESDEFERAGGIVRFLLQGDTVQFKLNEGRAREEGLHVNRRLLLAGIGTPLPGRD